MAHPRTGRKKPVSFRPPNPLREQFEAEADAQGRTRTDALTEAMHLWITAQTKRRRRAAG